jgi:hypothetical protein
MGIAEIAIGVFLVIVLLALALLTAPPSAWIGKKRDGK